MNPVRIAVVGVGYLGAFHAEKTARLPGASLVACVDADEARAREIAGKYGCRAETDFRSIIDDVDAVCLAVPTSMHHAIAKDLLSAGVDVLVEKPMATCLEECDELVEIADREGRILQVGHIERFNPAVVAVEGRIEAPLFIESHRMSPYRARGTEVDVVLDLMIHDLDIILHFVGEPVCGVEAVGVPVLTSSADIANARLHFEGGCIANVTASRISQESIRKIRFFQRDAYISINYEVRGAIHLKRVSGEGAEESTEIVAEGVSIEDTDALEAEIASFIESVTTRRRPVVSGADGRRALAVAQDVKAAIEKHAEQFEARPQGVTGGG